MKRFLRTGLIGIFFSATAFSVAHAIPTDPYGTKPWRTQPKPPRVTPATHCVVGNYAAFANPADTELDSYMFSGWCDVNVAPEDKDPVMQKVNVQIESEWSPKMKRASERVKIVHPDKSFEFSTWATCDKDPFIMGANAACKDQGMGGPDFSLFIRREDAPLSKSRVDASRVAQYTSRVTARTQIRNVGTIQKIETSTPQRMVGQEAEVKTTFNGGPGACPMQIDFGDGYVQQAFTSEEANADLASHPYKKPGLYTVKAKALPGCSGEAVVKVEVKAAMVEGVRGADSASKAGVASNLVVSGRAGACKMSVDFGDGKVESIGGGFAAAGSNLSIAHTYREPGRKNIKVSGVEGCTGSAATAIDVAPAAVKGLKDSGAVPPLHTLKLTTDGACPVRMDWGDGVVEELKNTAAGPGTITISHQFKKKGKLLVQARGIDGCVGVAGEWVTIN